MVRAMMVDKITHDVPETSTCRRHLKSEAKKAGNLCRKRIRMIAKEMWEEMLNSDEQQNNDSEKQNSKKRRATHSHSNDEGAAVRNYGRISVIGRRREMEDAVAVELDFVRKGDKSYDFYGVYDGHGGWCVAEACSEMMHKVLVEMILEEEEEGVCWEKVMVEGFRKMDEEVNKKGGMVAMTGSTAVVVGEDDLVVANCGDSRAVMRRGGAAVPLSDKPDKPDELERIEDSGGKVINWNGQRVLGVLATSRSIGDYYLKPYVITEPEVKVIKRTESDEFIILASDGLWDVLSNDLACQVTRRCLDGHIRRRDRGNCDDSSGGDDVSNNASVAAAVLAKLAIARGSRDNISVVVVELKRDSSGGNASSSCR